jgi:diacylglycerol kinase
MMSFLKSFSYAFKGLVYSLKQRNMKIILTCAILTILAAIFLKVNINHWCILLICIGLVMALEMINTAIEGIVDLISPDYNEKAGKIKDLAAGAVLVASIASLIIGILILGRYFLIFLQHK